ncbi:putative serine/threonine-protein kinase [Dorcoceras hygrometricum]|uniref:Putative serine/threonine-protein kinase n=1 Tax=Dorcoceras hygrometricum TaxID=472368 RepID=A0A2Z7B4R5_9LAMI|nr:putative serine/threonine-protein kinase [Dorcoceras hygrometricum]
MIHDHEGMVNMFKALEASGLRRFLGCESVLYETELGHFFDTALIQDEDITCVISGKFVSISPTLFATVFDSPSEGITNFSEVPKDKVYDARSLFSQKGVQIDVHGKKKYMKHEFRLLNDILAKAITVKACSFDSVTVERFQMMTAIQYGLKVNWGTVLFNVLKDMVDRSQKKAKGFAAQIGVLLKGIPAITMGDGVPFPSAKVLSMRTVHTYIVTNTTIDARTESEEPGMAKTPKAKKKPSSADEMPIDMFAEFTASKKRSATEADAPIFTKKRRTGKIKPSVSQVNLNIVQVATDVEPIQIVDPTQAAATVPSLMLKRKSRKRRLVLSGDSDDESVGTEEIIKEANAAVVISTVDADIAKVLEETLALGVTATERESQGVDEALFEEDFARWLDDFVARHNEPELVSTNNEAQATGSINSVVDKEVNMPIDDLLIQISDDLLLPITTAEVTMIKLGAFSTSEDKGKGKLVEDEHLTASHAQEIFALICRDVEVMVQVRDSVMQAVVDFFASFSLNNMPDIESLKDLKEKERLMLAWAETTTLAIAVRRQLYVLIKYRELLLRIVLESYQRYLTPDLPWNVMAVQVANLLSVAHSHSLEDLKAHQQELNIEMVQSHSSLPAIDYIDSGDVRLAHFYSIAKSTCWVRPVMLMNGVWTPVQGPDFWRSGCHLSLFLNKLRMPAPAIHEIFALHVSIIKPDQYWKTFPWLMRIWRWTKVCEEIVQFNMVGGLRPVRKDVCQDITVFNLGVERIPADFLHVFAQGLASHNFVDSVVKKDLGDTKEVVLTGVEEVYLVSSDVSTVYRSPSPPTPGVDSLEHDLRFARGPAIFSRVEQEERLYFVQSPDSPPAVSPHHASSSSSTDVSLHFDSTDVPVHAQAATHAPASVDFTKFTEAIEDLRSSLAQRIDDSNCEMLSKLNAVEVGVRGDILKVQSLLPQSFETACRVLERQSNTHTAQITDLKKGLMGPVGTIFGDLFDIKKKQREQDSRLTTMDEQIAAIRNEHLDFQSKIAADMLSLSTQVGDIADFLRSGAAKKGEVGSSSRPTAVRAQTQTLPPTTGTFEERVTQARRNIIETGQVISIEEAAARVIEADRRESERLERERRERRQSRSGTYKRRR